MAQGGIEYPYRVFVAGLSADHEPTQAPAALEACQTLPLTVAPGSTPAYAPGDRYAALNVVARFLYHNRYNIDYHDQLQEYTSTGDYLNYGAHIDYHADTSLRWTPDGLPLVRGPDGVYVLNPVTVGQFALSLHGKAVRGLGPSDRFLDAARGLIALQDERGAFPDPFAYDYYLTHEIFQPGWTSAMAQGVALSVFARAYHLSGDPVFVDAGVKALAYLTTWRAEGGVMHTLADLSPALTSYITFEEYPSHPAYYTLNGFGYTMLGLYDWSTVETATAAVEPRAAHYFECARATLSYSLPYYDLNGFSAYDLGHVISGAKPNLQPHYHAFHISLLHAINGIAPDPTLAYYDARWRDDVDSPP